MLVHRLALPLVLVVAAGLRLWHLDRNGYGNEYYTAGVRSMAQSWHNFLYHAFDPGGFVSVDKPPLAAWIQVLSVKLFGFHGLAVLLPQVVEGVASVWLVMHLVERRFGRRASLLAGLFMAVTPVSVAIDRSSNTDSCLVLVLLVASWALLRAAEDGSRWFLLLSMALIGLGFNVKMLAALVLLPVFALVYLLGAPSTWRRRVVDATLAGAVLAAVALPWVLAYDLTPADRRPYAGTTDANSILQLAVGPYGIGRFVRQARPAAIADSSDDGDAVPRVAATVVTERFDTAPRTGRSRLFVRAATGPLRLANGQLAAQVGWLLPFAIVGLALAAGGEPFRIPLAPRHLSLVLWCAWALTYGVVYSAAGGTFHFYYLATLAPPLAALAGIGVTRAWHVYAGRGRSTIVLPMALVVTGAWQLYVDAAALGGVRDLIEDLARLRTFTGAWRNWLHLTLAGGTLVAAIVLVIAILRRRSGPAVLDGGVDEPHGGSSVSTPISSRPGKSAALALGVGLAAALVMPAAWALSSVLVPGHGVLPAADLGRLLPDYADARPRRAIEAEDLEKLIAFLKSNRGGERYLLATSTVMLAAPIIIATGEPVMARGGFHGLDPILTPDKLARLVSAGEVRFVMLNDLSTVSRRLGAERAAQPVAEWVRANGKAIDPERWRTNRRTRMALYDLRPDRAR